MNISYFKGQGFSYREIARKTGHHRKTVTRYAENPELIGQGRARVERPSMLDGFRPMIESWLEGDNDLRATWILDKLRDMGYSGGYTIVKELAREIKAENNRIA